MPTEAMQVDNIRAYQSVLKDYVHQILLREPAPDNRIECSMRSWYVQNRQSLEKLVNSSHILSAQQLVETTFTLPETSLDPLLAELIIECVDLQSDEELDANPYLLYLKGLMLVNNLKFQHARLHFEEMEHWIAQRPDTPENRRLQGEVLLMLGDVLLQLGDISFDTPYRRVQALMPGFSSHRSNKLLSCENRDIFFLPGPEAGSLEAVSQKIVQVMPVVARFYNGCLQGSDLLFQTEAAYLTGRFDRVNDLANWAMEEARAAEQYDIVANALYYRMKAALMQNQPDLAWTLAREIERYVQDKENAALLTLADCAQGWVAVHTQQYDWAPRWIKEPYQPTLMHNPCINARTLVIQAAFALVQKDHAKLAPLLGKLESRLQHERNWVARVHLHILRAISNFRCGKRQMAMKPLWEAVQMCAANNIVTPFVEYGCEVLPLLQYALEDNRFRFVKNWLYGIKRAAAQFSDQLGGHKQAQAHLQAAKLLRITHTEALLLCLLMQGVDPDVIALEMQLSAETLAAKRDTLLEKLQADSMEEAVEIAQAIGLLSIDS